MRFDRKFLVCALSYVLLGMGLGIFMAASHNHAQRITHAHILLVGFVVSLVYAVIHKLWLERPSPTIAKVQFFLHQAGAITMFLGLFLLFGNMVPEAQLDPILAVASITVFVAAVLMLLMVFKGNPLDA